MREQKAGVEARAFLNRVYIKKKNTIKKKKKIHCLMVYERVCETKGRVKTFHRRTVRNYPSLFIISSCCSLAISQYIGFFSISFFFLFVNSLDIITILSLTNDSDGKKGGENKNK